MKNFITSSPQSKDELPLQPKDMSWSGGMTVSAGGVRVRSSLPG